MDSPVAAPVEGDPNQNREPVEEQALSQLLSRTLGLQPELQPHLELAEHGMQDYLRMGQSTGRQPLGLAPATSRATAPLKWTLGAGESQEESAIG